MNDAALLSFGILLVVVWVTVNFAVVGLTFTFWLCHRDYYLFEWPNNLFESRLLRGQYRRAIPFSLGVIWLTIWVDVLLITA